MRGAVSEPKWHSISEVWEGSCAIHKMYPEVEEADVPFAQDSVGDQFLLRNSQVWRLSAETGEIENLKLGLKSFFEAITNNPAEFLEMEPLIQLHNEGGALEPGQLIHVYPPFCTKESADGVTLKPVGALELLEFHAKFSSQLPPDGEAFEVRIVE